MPGGVVRGDPVEQRARLAPRVADVLDPEPDVRPVEAADDHLGVAQRAGSSTISSRTGGAAVAVSASSDRVAQRLAHVAQPQVVGPEVVAPLRDAVRLVDDEERRAGRAQARRRVSALASCSGASRTNSRSPRGQGLEGRVAVARGASSSSRSRRAAPVAGLLDRLELVALQRDERRDDDGRPVEDEARQLVDRRLARRRST